MKTWTVEEMVAERPCPEYTRERMAELWAGREALTLAEILDVPIAAQDRVWVACLPAVLPAAVQDAWLERIVSRAVTTHALRCGIPAVEVWAQSWLDGTDRTGAAARAAARAAAWAAAWAARAARAAAWEAARAAARAAAWAAAEAAGEAAREAARAARAAAWAAVEAAGAAAREAARAARAAEREQQIDDLRQILSSQTGTRD